MSCHGSHIYFYHVTHNQFVTFCLTHCERSVSSIGLKSVKNSSRPQELVVRYNNGCAQVVQIVRVCCHLQLKCLLLLEHIFLWWSLVRLQGEFLSTWCRFSLILHILPDLGKPQNSTDMQYILFLSGLNMQYRHGPQCLCIDSCMNSILRKVILFYCKAWDQIRGYTVCIPYNLISKVLLHTRIVFSKNQI